MATQQTSIYQCSECGLRYKKQGRLESHIRKKHNGDAEARELTVLDTVNPVIEPESQGVSECSTRIETYPHAGDPVDYTMTPAEEAMLAVKSTDIAPFSSRKTYNFAKWLIKHDIPVDAIDELLKNPEMPLDPLVYEDYSSNYWLRERVAQIPTTIEQWKQVTSPLKWHENDADFTVKYFQRDLIPCTKWLLRKQHFADHLVFTPQKRFEGDRRVYIDLDTADWWWKKQEEIEVGGTVIPLIFMSDATHVTNYSGGLQVWPIYMTIGNLSSEMRKKTSSMSTITVANIPTPPKLNKCTNAERDTYRNKKNEILQSVIATLIDSISSESNLNFNAYCADGKVRLCFPKVVGWIGDYPEHIKIQGLKSGQCFWCEIKPSEFGNDATAATLEKLQRDSSKYQRLFSEDNSRLTEVGVQNNVANVLWKHCGEGLPIGNLSFLPMPDVLHTIYLGVLKHLMEWLLEFLIDIKRLDEFNAAFKSVPPYLQRPGQKKTYQEVKQWAGGDMRKLSNVLMACFYIALRGISSGALLMKCQKALKTVSCFLEFCFYASYKSHDENTLQYMTDAWSEMHQNKSVFAKYRATKRTKKAAKEKRVELRKERDADLGEVIEAHGSYSRRQRIYSDWQFLIDMEVDEALENGSHFAFPKMHLPLHYPEMIKLIGIITQWSAETSERTHIEQVKTAFRATNKQESYFEQMLQHNMRHDVFSEKDLESSAIQIEEALFDQESERDKVLDELTLDDIPVQKRVQLASHHYTRRDKHPCVIKTCKELNEYIEINCFYSELDRFLVKNRSIRLDKARMDGCAVKVYHTARVQVTAFGTEKPVEQRIRCTIKSPWFKSHGIRRDWVWSDTDKGGQYGVFQGHLPARLVCMFEITVESTVIPVAFVERTSAINGGIANEYSKLARVEKPTRGTGYKVISTDYIQRAAHLIPDEPLKDQEMQTSWVVNSHIDLETWNKLY